jgi:hypothetical protein
VAGAQVDHVERNEDRHPRVRGAAHSCLIHGENAGHDEETDETDEAAYDFDDDDDDVVRDSYESDEEREDERHVSDLVDQAARAHVAGEQVSHLVEAVGGLIEQQLPRVHRSNAAGAGAKRQRLDDDHPGPDHPRPPPHARHDPRAPDVYEKWFDAPARTPCARGCGKSFWYQGARENHEAVRCRTLNLVGGAGGAAAEARWRALIKSREAKTRAKRALSSASSSSSSSASS